MNLLILTQKVDKNDDILGFFHNWIEKFSLNYEKITVIALGVGDYNLSSNVKVFSLGKENNLNKFRYILNLYRLILEKRKEYDAVFVHMNVEYVLLAGFIWKLLSKRIVLWYNHRFGGLKASLANLFVYKIFYTSPFSFYSKNKKAVIMPVGIDTEVFKNLDNKQGEIKKILSLGRISPVKNIDVLIKVAILLDNENVDFTLDIYGDAPIKDNVYYSKIKDMAKPLLDKKKICFFSSLSNNRTPEIFNKHGLFVNLTDSGSFDKTILEAMSCERLVLTSNKSLGKNLSKHFLFEEGDLIDLKNKIKEILLFDNDMIKNTGKDFRKFVNKNHSLVLLMDKFREEIN